MRYVALAVDYDGSLADNGTVSEACFQALDRLRASGRKLLLVTGRGLDDVLQHLGQQAALFDRVVAENGGVLYTPESHERRALAEPPPDSFVDALRASGVDPLWCGDVIVATREPHQQQVLRMIQQQGLELHITFNKGAVMVLPAGVDKRSGLLAALDDVHLSPHNVVGVGDGENDHAFLSACEAAVATANAVPGLRKAADLVTDGADGSGVIGVIERLLADDLAGLEPKLKRHRILLGEQSDGRDRGDRVALSPYGTNLLVVGSSKAGKSSLTLGLLERLTATGYQYCLLDPEGDYEHMPGAVNLGDEQQVPSHQEILDMLERPDQSVVVSLLGARGEDRPDVLAALLPHLVALRARTGRPHWLLVDEAQQLLPSAFGPAAEVVPQGFGGLALLSLRASSIAPAAIGLVNTICCIGQSADERLAEFCELVQEPLPALPTVPPFLKKGQALFWRRGRKRARLIQVEPSKSDRKRHRRKYAKGELAPELSFYFRGPEGRLNLRAQNLQIFLQLADGVDDATWLHHLNAGDYARWVQEVLKDTKLARAIRSVERDQALSPSESRKRVRAAVEERYAPPAE